MEDSSVVAKRIFRADWDHLTSHEREVIEGVLFRLSKPRDANREFADHRTFGEQAADAIASFGGSWTFICIFSVFLLFWAFLNTEILGPRHAAFDPYPYIFLNLMLSMLAAIQAPVILMSQKRSAARDRLEAEIDHEVNVRAELAIRHLTERLASLERSVNPSSTGNDTNEK